MLGREDEFTPNAPVRSREVAWESGILAAGGHYYLLVGKVISSYHRYPTQRSIVSRKRAKLGMADKGHGCLLLWPKAYRSRSGHWPDEKGKLWSLWESCFSLREAVCWWRRTVPRKWNRVNELAGPAAWSVSIRVTMHSHPCSSCVKATLLRCDWYDIASYVVELSCGESSKRSRKRVERQVWLKKVYTIRSNIIADGDSIIRRRFPWDDSEGLIQRWS